MKQDKNTGSVCVYCASSADIDESYITAARELGSRLAMAGWHLINGGGQTGLMGAVTDGALAAGGEVTGVIPKFMVDNGWEHHDIQDFIITADMHQRKLTMSEISDAVIAMPGGVGTLEELLEALTWRQLGLVEATPVIILNINGYYDALLQLLDHAIHEGFMKPSHDRLWSVVDTPQEAVSVLENIQPVTFDCKNPSRHA